MIRFLGLALLGVLIFLVLRAFVRKVAAGFLTGLGGTARAGGGPRAILNELVKDPVCETYVPRRTAVTRTAGPTTYYFCSPACAAKFKTPS